MGRTISVFIILAVFAIGQNEVNARSALKIVNGTDAQEGEFPYMVQLVGDILGIPYFLCGGSIIGPEWILTAGHCLYEQYASYITVGSNTIYGNDFINVKNSWTHPKWTVGQNSVPSYDIALVQLEKPLEFNNKVQAVKLPDNEDVPFHVMGKLCGWGVQSTQGKEASDYLQKISLQLLNDEECSEKINGKRRTTFNPAHHLCSDDHWNGECFGDSGSPFVINGTQYGVVSWSFKPCGSFPGAYSRISNPEYRGWIRNITGI